MPQPEFVNPAAFTVRSVLYNHDDFSIALGIWNDNETNQIAMRWNDANDGNGYPKVFAHPQWFLISEEVSRSLLFGLLGNTNLTTQEYQNILDALRIL